MPFLGHLFPLWSRLQSYQTGTFISDLIAGVVVAVMLVPQAMAYSMMAGLSPEVGLYASIVPLLVYAFLGTSNTLAVGPVAMVALLVFAGVGQLAPPGTAEFYQYSLTLALLIGLLHLLMAVFRLGFLVNFISHPVLVGFTSAAAIVIGMTQFKHLLGVEIADSEFPVLQILPTLQALGGSQPVTVIVSLLSIGLLCFFANYLSPLLQRFQVSRSSAEILAKLGPLFVVGLSATIAWRWSLSQQTGLAVVGEIPGGFPPWTTPVLGLGQIKSLLPLAMVVTVIGYLESISVAKALANFRKEKISPNRELVGLGAANVSAAFTGGMPVTGGFSRSLVNFSAGAQTQVASVVTALLVVLSLLLLTPLFYHIPKAVLAAIIVVAVARLIDLKTPWKLWRYCPEDAIASLITLLAVLIGGIERGIVIGIASAFVLLFYRQSRPHIAVVGKVESTGNYRNRRNFQVEPSEGILALRVDESLNFINTEYFQNYLMEQVSQHSDLKSVLLIASGINDIDSTGIDAIRTIKQQLSLHGIELYLSDVKRPVADRLRLSGFDESFFEDRVFQSVQQAMNVLNDRMLAKSVENQDLPMKSKSTVKQS
jgi:SulP family sulfate permease